MERNEEEMKGMRMMGWDGMMMERAIINDRVRRGYTAQSSNMQ